MSPEKGPPSEPLFDLGPYNKDALLPADLGNACMSANLGLFSYGRGEMPEERLREKLRAVRTFEKYFRDSLKAANAINEKMGLSRIYDEERCLAAELQRAGLDLIAQYNEKIGLLHELADAEKLDIKKSEKIVGELKQLIYGKK